MQPISDAAAARIVLWTVAAAYLSVPVVLIAADFSLSFSVMGGALGVVSLLVPFMIYTRWRKMAVLPTAFDCIAAVLALTLPILVWTYAAMRVNMPLADEELAALDSALGFDWHAFISFVDARPMLATALAFAYSSFSFQLLLVPALMALAGKSCRAYAMVFAYTSVCLVASVVGVWFPALGAYVVNEVGQQHLASIDVKFGYFFLEQFNAVRSTDPFTLIAEKSAGILTFPSVHAAVAAICAWAAWDAKLLRYPILVLNIGMGASAISHGSHYLIDVIAGIGVAGFCISVATLVFYKPDAARSPILAAIRNAVTALAKSRASPAAASD